jgi:hypothetical protein
MSRNIFVDNKSGHDQEFEVHGWNNNKNMVVKAHSRASIRAAGGSSGAIIALHNGHEGEQAEITKNGFGGELSFRGLAHTMLGSRMLVIRNHLTNFSPFWVDLGNDFFDLSNIVGAGGNLTVMQVGEPSTLKGDPLFMQHLNTAWKKADQRTKKACASCVHLDHAGNVVRIDAIKDNPSIEPLIRTFADNKTYIGVGAWNGSPGHPSDNNQVSLSFSSLKTMLMTV